MKNCIKALHFVCKLAPYWPNLWGSTVEYIWSSWIVNLTKKNQCFKFKKSLKKFDAVQRLYCAALHWCDDKSNNLLLLVLEIRHWDGKGISILNCFSWLLVSVSFRYKDGDPGGFFSCFQRPRLPGHSTRWLDLMKKQNIWYLGHFHIPFYL